MGLLGALKRVAHVVTKVGEATVAPILLIKKPIKRAVDHAADAFEHSAIGNNEVCHFLGGVVTGTTGSVVAATDLPGQVLDGSTAKGVAHVAAHPRTRSKSLERAWPTRGDTTRRSFWVR